jgi:trimethylamine-N-oxide reductase (cytochrome c)
VVVESSELVVFWGANPMLTNQIAWSIADHDGYAGLKALKAAGKKVICIDPEKTETCTYLNAEWLAPKPQTDVALMLGIAHTLVARKAARHQVPVHLHHRFDKFLPYLMGDTDKTPKTAEWAAAISGIPAATIKDLAKRFAKNRTMLASGWSIQRQHHGEQAHWMLVTLASMLGQIGLPGGGFGLSYHYANGGSPSADSPVMPGITDGGKAVAGAAWLTSAGCGHHSVCTGGGHVAQPGKTV